jgi:hypothetical protein
MSEEKTFAVTHTWKHIAFKNPGKFTETYGFSGAQGAVNLEGILLRPEGRPSPTLLIFMHPASTLHLLPLPNRLAARGGHGLWAGSRDQRQDTALIGGNLINDHGADIRAARQDRG